MISSPDAPEYATVVRETCEKLGWDLEAFEKGIKLSHALQRGGRPDEVIGAALYFASDASSFCTGAILRLDGGGP